MRLSEIKPKNIPPPPPRLPMSHMSQKAESLIAWQRHLSDCLKEADKELEKVKKMANFAIIALSISNLLVIVALFYLLGK
jgi:hypothetical protein